MPVLGKALAAFAAAPERREKEIIVIAHYGDPRARTLLRGLIAAGWFGGPLPVEDDELAVLAAPRILFLELARAIYDAPEDYQPDYGAGTTIAVLVENGVHFLVAGSESEVANSFANRYPGYEHRPLADAPESFDVRLACLGCRTPGRLSATWIYVVSDPRDWDGVFAGAVHRCATCGAIDEYEIDEECLRELRATAARHGHPFLSGTGHEGGTKHVVILLRRDRWPRASAALRLLREEAVEDGRSAHRWRAYGILAESLEDWDAAIEAHTGVCAADPEAIDGPLFLAWARFKADHGDRGGRENFQGILDAVEQTVRLIPHAKFTKADDRHLILGLLVLMLQRLVDAFASGDQNFRIVLVAAWKRDAGGKGAPVRTGALNLTAKTDWDALAAFMSRGDLVEFRVTYRPEPVKAEGLREAMAAWRRKHRNGSS